jgi:hypothetical protein
LHGQLIGEAAARRIGLAWGAVCVATALGVALSDPGLLHPVNRLMETAILVACIGLMALVGLAAAVQSAVAISGEVTHRTVDLVRLTRLSAGAVVYGYVVAAKRHLALLRWLLLGATVGAWASGGVLSDWMIGRYSVSLFDWILNLMISLMVMIIPALLGYLIMYEFMQMATTEGVVSGLVAASSEQAVFKAVLRSGTAIGLLLAGIGAAMVVPWLLVIALLAAALLYSKREEAVIFQVVRCWEAEQVVG